MKKVALYTLGCKVNQYETEAMGEVFVKEGYQLVDFKEKADIYVINTCTVTNLSDRKSRQIIRKAKARNEHSIVVVTGCYAQTAPDEVLNIPGVNIVLGTKDRNKVIDYIKELQEGESINLVSDIMGTKIFEDLNIESYTEKTRAFIKIQEGCNQFCSYCIIPYARGPIRSRSPEMILNEVQRLSKSGFKEIVLTGIHIASYGKDTKTTSLIDIISRIHDIDGIERIRLGSIEPNTLTRDFVNSVKYMKKVSPHYHVSLQSGCDETLKRMNRKYTTEFYKRATYDLKQNIENVALTTDVIVGFPGETEEEFLKTLNFLECIGFSKMHVFKYSPRNGTPAATYDNQVNPDLKQKRSDLLLELSNKMQYKFNEGFIGKNMSVLFEQELKDKPGFVEGLTQNYIRVLCEGNSNLCGKIVDVALKNAISDYIEGEILL